MIPIAASTLGSVDAVRETSRFRVIDTRHASELCLQRHSHEHAGVTFVLKGGYREPHSRGELDCRAGTMVFKPAGFTHANHYGPVGAQALHVEIGSGNGDDDLILPEQIVELEGAQLRYLREQLRQEFGQSDAAAQLALEALCLHLVSLLVREDERQEAGTAPRWFNQAVELLHDTQDVSLTLRDVAEAVQVPPRRVAREFRQRLRCSVGEYARRVRIDSAAGQLVNSRKALSEIALAAGFCDQSHFARVFKNALGVTPGEYRRLHES